MKTKLALEELKRLVYHNYESANNDYFEEELSSKLNLDNKDSTIFEDNLLIFLIRMHLIRLGVITNPMYPRLEVSHYQK